jgi:hypothetical protein
MEKGQEFKTGNDVKTGGVIQFSDPAVRVALHNRLSGRQLHLATAADFKDHFDQDTIEVKLVGRVELGTITTPADFEIYITPYRNSTHSWGVCLNSHRQIVLMEMHPDVMYRNLRHELTHAMLYVRTGSAVFPGGCEGIDMALDLIPYIDTLWFRPVLDADPGPVPDVDVILGQINTILDKLKNPENL